MAYYRRIGSVPPKRHTQHRRDSGELYYEELMGEEGFSSDSSLLYHRNVPSSIVDAARWRFPDQATSANHPLKARHLRLHELFPDQEWKATDVVTGRRLVLGNADVRISYVAAGTASPLYRNALGDECVYVESGSGMVETVFGRFAVGQGDYVLLPRATTTTAGSRTAPIRCVPIASRRIRTSRPPSAICLGTGSSWSIRRSANAT